MAATSSSTTPLHKTSITPSFVSTSGAPSATTLAAIKVIGTIQARIQLIEEKIQTISDNAPQSAGYHAYRQAQLDQNMAQLELNECEIELEKQRCTLDAFVSKRKVEGSSQLIEDAKSLAAEAEATYDSTKELGARLDDIAKRLTRLQPSHWKTAASYIPYAQSLYTAPAPKETHASWKEELERIIAAAETLRREESTLRELFEAQVDRQVALKAKIEELEKQKILHRRDWKVITAMQANDLSLLSRLSSQIAKELLNLHKILRYPAQRRYHELTCRYVHSSRDKQQSFLEALPERAAKDIQSSMGYAGEMLKRVHTHLARAASTGYRSSLEPAELADGAALSDRLFKLPVISIEQPRGGEPKVEQLLLGLDSGSPWVQSVSTGKSPLHYCRLSTTAAPWALEGGLVGEHCAVLVWDGLSCHIQASCEESPRQAQNLVVGCINMLKERLQKQSDLFTSTALLFDISNALCELQKQLQKQKEAAAPLSPYSLAITLMVNDKKKAFHLAIGPSCVLRVPTNNESEARCCYYSLKELPTMALESRDWLQKSIAVTAFDIEPGDCVLSLSPHLARNLHPKNLGLPPLQLLQHTRALRPAAKAGDTVPTTWKFGLQVSGNRDLREATQLFVGALASQLINSPKKVNKPEDYCLRLFEHVHRLTQGRNSCPSAEISAEAVLGEGNSVAATASLLPT